MGNGNLLQYSRLENLTDRESLARISWTESTESHRVRLDRRDLASMHAPCRKAVKMRWPWGAERRWEKVPENSSMLLPPSVQERKDPVLRQYLYLVFLQPRDKGRGWRTSPGGRGLRERTGSRGPSLQQPEAGRRGGVSGGSGTRASGDASGQIVTWHGSDYEQEEDEKNNRPRRRAEPDPHPPWTAKARTGGGWGRRGE